MRLRITGTADECATAVEALGVGFVLREVSGFPPHRGGSLVGRVYVDADPRDAAEGWPAPAGRVDAGPFRAAELADRGVLAARLAQVDASLVVRTARKPWRCTGATGRNHLPSCTGAEITPGEVHAEYLGDASAYGPGSRWHAACAVEAFTRPRPADGEAAVDLDALTSTAHTDRTGDPS